MAGSDISTSIEPKVRAWRVLYNRNYALLFCGQFVSAIGTQVQVVAVAWQVYLLTHSAVALGIIGLLQAVPRIIFSLVGGVSADAFDRRKLLLLVQSLLAALSTVLALCTVFHVINLFIVYGVVLLAASVSAFDFPTRQAILPNLVSRDQRSHALSLFMLMGQLSGIIGPAIGGFVIAWFGLATSYWLDAISYGVVIASLFFMVLPPIPIEKRARAGIASLLEGWRFLRTRPIILSIITLDFFAVLFGAPFALLPIFASAILHVGAQGLGILLAANSIGAFALTPFVRRISRIKRQGLGIVLAILVWGLCIIAFGLFPFSLWLSVLLVAGAGAADMVSMILRFLVIQLITPDEFRGRIGAVNAMFAFSGTQLGQLESGVVPSFTSPQFSVISGGAICILATIVLVACVPGLLRVQVKDAVAIEQQE